MILLRVHCVSLSDPAIKKCTYLFDTFIVDKDAVHNRRIVDNFQSNLSSTVRVESDDAEDEEYLGFVLVPTDVTISGTSLTTDSTCVVSYENRRCCSLMNYRNVSHSVKFEISVEFYSCLIREIRRSSYFRSLFIDNVEKKCLKSSKLDRNDICNRCRSRKPYTLNVNIVICWPGFPVIDKKWNRMLTVLVQHRCELDNTMAWLSTLGGAFSALGDSFTHHADCAAKVSVEQLKNALILGDPVILSKCKIYWAMSLIQRGHYRQAKKILQKEYIFAVSAVGKTDFRLVNMCKAVWNRLQYLKKKNIFRVPNDVIFSIIFIE